MFVYIFFNSLFWYNEFTEVRKDSLHFDLIMNHSYYESISVTWANSNMISINQTRNGSSWKSSFYSTEKLVMTVLQNIKEKTFDLPVL